VSWVDTPGAGVQQGGVVTKPLGDLVGIECGEIGECLESQGAQCAHQVRVVEHAKWQGGQKLAITTRVDHSRHLLGCRGVVGGLGGSEEGIGNTDSNCRNPAHRADRFGDFPGRLLFGAVVAGESRCAQRQESGFNYRDTRHSV